MSPGRWWVPGERGAPGSHPGLLSLWGHSLHPSKWGWSSGRGHTSSAPHLRSSACASHCLMPPAARLLHQTPGEACGIFLPSPFPEPQGRCLQVTSHPPHLLGFGFCSFFIALSWYCSNTTKCTHLKRLIRWRLGPFPEVRPAPQLSSQLLTRTRRNPHP